AGAANSKVRLGVVGVDGGGTTWIDLGSAPDFYLPRAGWTPAGQLWFEWLSRDQRRLELRVVDATSGAVRPVLADEDPAWINVDGEPTFLDGRRFLWTSERDGWRHLYLYDLDGRPLGRVTQGPWQVEAVYGLDARKTRVFFQATEKDPRERH